MKAKHYLRQVRRVDDLVRIKFEQIEILESIATKVTTDLTSEKVQNSSEQDKMSNIVAKIIDLKNELANDIERLLTLQKEVRVEIDGIENQDYRLLLSLRYLSFRTWEEIAVEMGYSYQWIHIIHRKALQEFETAFGGKLNG